MQSAALRTVATVPPIHLDSYASCLAGDATGRATVEKEKKYHHPHTDITNTQAQKKASTDRPPLSVSGRH
uniref:Uncharacterized protein n=1 Tax=Oryza sativa subsp. japonica TaxID=39947 RepID=Q6ES32_ORYSJ|nr:hypothetical protein [Oryza sativa Japonica Group]